MTSASSPSLSPLVPADQSVLALIMPNILLADGMRSAKAGDVLSGLSGLACAGKVLGALAILYAHEDEKQFGAPAADFDAALSEDDRHDATALDPWKSEPFQMRIEKLGRRQLVIGGFSTDSAVTYLAMQALFASRYVRLALNGVCALERRLIPNSLWLLFEGRSRPCPAFERLAGARPPSGRAPVLCCVNAAALHQP